MTYSCTDFTDAVLNHLAESGLLLSGQYDPQDAEDQATHAVAAIRALQARVSGGANALEANGRTLPSATLVSSENGFDDYNVEGIPTVHRIAIGHRIRKGESFNVYCNDSRKIGCVWQGTLEKSLAHLVVSLEAEAAEQRNLPSPSKHISGTERDAIGLEVDQLPSLGIALVESLGSENIYVIKDGLHYYCKVMVTEQYEVGEWDFVRHRKVVKSSGQSAYERDLAVHPTRDDGAQRPGWERLGDVAKDSWERNPTDRRIACVDEQVLVEKAIAHLKASGKVVVEPKSPGWGEGFEAFRVIGGGGFQRASICFGTTKEGTWLAAAIRIAEYKPGALQMTSREYRVRRTTNIVCQDGSLGILESRARLEIRKLADRFEVFDIQCHYLGDETPRDVSQMQVGGPFQTLAQAADFVGTAIDDYLGAAADDREAALEAQHE